MQPNIPTYLGWIFQVFFRWWWAALTGTASIAAFFGTPQSGITLSNIAATAMILVVLTLIFLTVSVLVQGWSLYRDRNRQPEVVSIRESKDLGSDWIFVIDGYLQESSGALIEVRRVLEDTEVPFALVKVVEQTRQGYYQAVPIWLSPGHLRDFTQQKFERSALRAKTSVTYDRIRSCLEAFDESAE